MSVTTADTSRRKTAPRQRRIFAVLAVSIALNLCVVAGAAWNRYSVPPPQTSSERLRQLADKLELTPQQRVTFDAYIAATAARSDRMRQDLDPMMDSVWAEIAKPDADQTRILQLLDDVGSRRRAFLHEAVGATLSMLAALTPEQRDKFLANERAFHAAQRRRHAEEAR